MAKGAGAKLLGLELGRFWAALLVVLFHFSYGFANLHGDRQFLSWFRAGHCGVDYFFVLSGFIIYHVHYRDIGVAGMARPFAIKRFLRLYPSYWAIFAVMLVLTAVTFGIGSWGGGDRILDALLLPYGGKPMIGQAWTLRHEIVFYAFFALVILRPRIGWVAFVAWQIVSMIVGVAYAGHVPWAIEPVLHVYNIGFAAGLLAGWAYERFPNVRSGALAALGLAATLALMVWETRIGQDVPPERWPLGEVASPLLYMAAAVPLVIGLAGWQPGWAVRHARVVGWLGGCSYVLYLIHNLFMSVALRVPLTAKLPAPLAFALMVTGVVAGAILLHLWAEKPMLAALRRRMLPR